jgi:C4-dicarboxylate-specific signal transduction histidine kinase
METNAGANRFISSLPRFALAIGLVATALALSLLLQNVVSTVGYLFFYSAVVAATWFAGRWPGWLAVVLSTLTVEYFFMPPIHSFRVDRNFLPVFIEFAASSAVISWFSSWRKRAEGELRYARDELHLRVEERTAELKQTNERLLAEIAERKRAEDAYYEAQAELARVTRMSSMGALAASISHEVNQPLAAVVTNADACMMWLSSEPPNLEEVRLAVESIAQEGTRASDIVRQIRAMFTKSTPERSRVGINELLHTVSSIMQVEAARHQVTIETKLSRENPAVMADRVQLQQVIVNLIQNGIEAMIAVTGHERRLVIKSEMSGPDELLVAVIDSGVGIDPKNQKRIFDAFFTTKARGMGMGLSISHSVIEAHGGRLWARANSDHGVTLQFTLPAVLETVS